MFYFLNHRFKFSDRLRNSIWSSKIAYLSDICSKLNEKYLTQQNKETKIFRAQDNIFLSCKRQYWTLEVEHHYFYCFPLAKCLQEFEVDLDNEIFGDIKGHLNNFPEILTEYFSKLKNKDHYGQKIHSK